MRDQLASGYRQLSVEPEGRDLISWPQSKKR
jgi:hypothetical protein